MGGPGLSDFGLFMCNGGFLLIVLPAWLVFSRQRDVLETAETASRIVAGTLLVLFQLAYYTTLALVVFVPPLRSTPWGNLQWTSFGLAVAYLLPLLVSLSSFAIYSKVFLRKWQLRPVQADHPIHNTITELSERIGLRRTVKVYETAALIPGPFVFQLPFRPATLVLPWGWAHWGPLYAQDKQVATAVRRFVLLHELSHMRNGDVFFMTWAGVFLWGYRFWAPIVVLIQLIALSTGLGSLLWFAATFKLGIVATVVIYPLFRLLYLSVSRERELLADARAQLYLTKEQLALLLQRATLFAEPAARQGLGKKAQTPWWRGLGRTIADMVRTLVIGWAPLAVLPIVEAIIPDTPVLATHPPRQVRYHALQERSVIQSHIGAVSSSVACWVGIVVGVFTAFLLLPLFYGTTGLASDSALEVLLTWGALFTMLYPTLALCLPLRNALAHVQPLGAQIRQLLWRFGQAGFCFIGVFLLGYVNTLVAFSLTEWGPLFFQVYAIPATIGVMLSPFLSILILAFLRYLFRILDREGVLAVLWIGVMTVVLFGVILFQVMQIQSSDAQPPSYTLLNFVIMGIAMAAGLLTVGRLITQGTSFRQRTITIYWGGRSPRVWRKEYSTTAAHLFWSTLLAAGHLGLVAVAPVWVAKLGFDALYHAAPISIESLWAQLAVFAGLLAFVLFALERSNRITASLTEGTSKRQVFLRDTGQLVEVGSALDIHQEEMPKALSHCLPAELLAAPVDAPAMPWWISAMTLETVDWASRLAIWHFGPGALSSAVVEHVKRCACTEGGFGLWPGGSPRLSATYHALRILANAKALSQIDHDVHANWISNCTDAEGGFRSPEHRNSSLQDTVDAVRTLALLDRLDLLDRARYAEWVERVWLRSDRDLEQTRCAITCLAILDALTPNFAALLESSWLPRYWSLVVSMRVDKQIDRVWNYAQIVSHLFTPSSEAFATWTDGLSENVSEGWAAFLDTAA